MCKNRARMRIVPNSSYFRMGIMDEKTMVVRIRIVKSRPQAGGKKRAIREEFVTGNKKFTLISGSLILMLHVSYRLRTTIREVFHDNFVYF